MTTSDKRQLFRNSNKFGAELSCSCLIGGISYSFEVVDFNTLGIKLRSLELRDLTSVSIERIQIKYFEKVICDFNGPRVVRSEGSDLLILSLDQNFFDRNQSNLSNRSLRAPLPQMQQGVLWGVDPMTIEQLLYFRVTDISESGFRLISSKTNNHIFPGMEFENFELQIPGFQVAKVSFRIVNVKDQSDFLSFGCKFTKLGKGLQKTIKKVSVILGDPLSTNSEDNSIFKFNIKETKRFRGHILVRQVKGQKDYQEVLKIRFKAYKAAQKVATDQTVESMSDVFDKHSIILIGYIGSKAVGTLRMVIKSSDSTLPCETHFSLSQFPEIGTDGPIAEISRFAIDPMFQGTDLFLGMARKLLMEIAAKNIAYPLCLATPKMAGSYISLGAVPISEPIPHPIAADQTLTLYWLKPDNVLGAKTGSLSWIFIIRPALQRLRSFGYTEQKSNGLIHFIRAPFELLNRFIERRLTKRLK